MSHACRNGVRSLALLCGLTGWVFADAAVNIALPASDLVRSDLPFVIQVTLPPGVEHAEGTLSLTRQTGKGGEAAAIAVPLALDRQGDEAQPLVINAAPLAEGEYLGTVILKGGEQEVRASFSLFRMPEGRPSRGIRFGTYAVPFSGDAAVVQATVDKLHRHGLDMIQTHINDIWQVNKPYDRAARLGIDFMPSITTLGIGIPRDDAHEIVFADGDKPKWPWVCFNNADARAKAADAMSTAIQGFQRHGGFSGLVYTGDDLVIPVKREDGKVIIGCYCETCRQGFRQQAGVEPPVTIEPKTGVLPVDDVYLQWMRYRVGTVYGDFVKTMREAKDRVAPGVRIGLIHGWSGQPFINVAQASYSPVTHRHADVVSSYTYPNHRYARMNFIAHYEMALMNNRDKDAWMLGILGMNGTLMHDFVVNQNYWNMLAAGYKLIGLFGWNEIVARDADSAAVGKTPHLDQTLEALARVGRHKDWIFPAAAHWRREPARHAVLFSFTTEAVDVMPEPRGFKHLADVLEFYREALRQRVPMEFVCEEEIRDGALARYDGLCLHGVRALPKDVHERVEAYAAGGGAVYLSDTELTVTNGVTCSLETAVALCGDAVSPPVTIPDRDVIVRDFRAGAARYYVLVNNYADRYYGLPFDYGNPEANYAQGRMIQEHNRTVSSVATFRDKGQWLFDMSTGEPLGSHDEPYAFSLEPSWGQVVVGLPVKQVGLDVSGPAQAVQGDTVVWKLRFVDPERRTVAAAFTVKVSIVDPQGRPSGYSGSFSVPAGELDVPLRLGANDATGVWSVRLEGGFPREAATLTLNVADGKEMPALVMTGTAK